MMESKIIAIRREDISLANEAFAELMSRTERFMNEQSLSHPQYFKGMKADKLEVETCDYVRLACQDSPFNPENVILVSGHTFPDIVAEKYYGIEVKSTKSNHWTSTGSSIVESTRSELVENIYMMFGKLGGNPPEFRCRPYQEVLYDIAVTHSPRYLINMELQDGETIFDKMNTTYDEFRTTENNIAKVREYYKEKAKKARKQEMPWWISSEDDEKPINFTLRLWNSVDADERKTLIAYCLILFPEIWMPDANSRTKYNQASLWLCSFAQVVFPNIRDAFTAGGKVAYENGHRLTTRYPQVYKTIIEHLPIIKQLLERPTKETIEIVAEFNPLLLQGKGLYNNWAKICGATLGGPMERWLIEQPRLDCE